MKTRKSVLTITLSLLVSSILFPPVLPAEPRDLLEIFRLAVERDPLLRGSRDRLRASEELRPQARALFLPELNLEGGVGYNWEEVEIGDFNRRRDFREWDAGLALTQPLFRMESFSLRRQADIFVDQASLRLATTKQQLLLRTSDAYFGILLAQEQLRTVDAELAAIETELRRARRALEVGTGTITDVNDAQARFDLVTANRLRAVNDLTIARETLRRLIDEPPGELMALQENFEAQPPEPADSAAWAERAERFNLEVRLSEREFEQAREGVAQERAGRYPQVDLVARHGWTFQSEPGVTGTGVGTQPLEGELETEQTSVGVRLTMPLYTGGGTSARIRERQAERDAVFTDTLDAKRTASLEAESAYLNLVSNLEQIRALEQAKMSIRSTEASTRRGVEVGTRTTLDLLNVQRERFEIERQLAEARYGYLFSYLQLQVAAGGGVDDTSVEDVNFFLTHDPRGDNRNGNE